MLNSQLHFPSVVIVRSAVFQGFVLCNVSSMRLLITDRLQTDDEGALTGTAKMPVGGLFLEKPFYLKL